jgi:transcriptional regulator with XRE-family HTH domain
MTYREPRLDSRNAIAREEVEAGGEETVHERSQRRSTLVMPILASKRWARSRWATKAGVGKNSVYEYLSGKRNLSFENRQALAEELGLSPEELPDYIASRSSRETSRDFPRDDKRILLRDSTGAPRRRRNSHEATHDTPEKWKYQ